jgi:hypothetical protein
MFGSERERFDTGEFSMPVYILGSDREWRFDTAGDADTFTFDQSVTETGNRLYVGNLTMDSSYGSGETSYDSGGTSDGDNAIAVEGLKISHEELDRGNVHLHTYWSVEDV